MDTLLPGVESFVLCVNLGTDSDGEWIVHATAGTPVVVTVSSVESLGTGSIKNGGGHLEDVGDLAATAGNGQTLAGSDKTEVISGIVTEGVALDLLLSGRQCPVTCDFTVSVDSCA